MRFDRPKAFPRAVISIVACLAAIGSMAVPAAAQSSGWQPGPGAAGDNTYTGYIDVPTNGATVPGSGSFLISGWFVDTTAEGWAGADQGQVWLGTMDGGGKMLAQANIAQGRPDVATALGNPFYVASGFNAIINGSSVPAGSQTLYMYMHTPSKGWWFRTVSVNGGGSASTATAAAPGNAAGGAPVVTVTQPEEGANVNAKGSSDYNIQGTATDPTYGPGAIDRVEVWILGEPDTGTQLGTTTPASDGSWSVTFKPTNFPSTHVNIYVIAHSKATGKSTEVIRGFNIKG